MDFKKLYVIDTAIHSFESDDIVCRNVFNTALQRHMSAKNRFSYMLETEDNFYCIGTTIISRLSINKTRIFVREKSY